MRWFSWPIGACQGEGEVVQLNKRVGLIAKWRVRWRYFEGDICGGRYFGNLWLWRKERIKEMEKGKEMK